MKGRKGFIYSRSAYYRDYYQRNKEQYQIYYQNKKNKEKEKDLRDYYKSFYLQKNNI